MSVAEASTLIAATGAFVVACAGAFVSVWNAIHIQKVHVMVNGQSARIESLARSAGFAEGARSDLKILPTYSEAELPRP